MKLIPIILTIVLMISFSNQDTSNWELIENEQTLEITKSANFKIKNYDLQLIWTDSLHTTHKGYYGGIKSATFLLDGTAFQTIDSLKDGIGLGYINLSFFDYNMDGFIDFSFPKSCGRNCLDQYYLFDNDKKEFILVKEWDNLRIHKLDKENRLILTMPEGMEGKQKIFKIENNNFLSEI